MRPASRERAGEVREAALRVADSPSALADVTHFRRTL